MLLRFRTCVILLNKRRTGLADAPCNDQIKGTYWTSCQWVNWAELWLGHCSTFATDWALHLRDPEQTTICTLYRDQAYRRVITRRGSWWMRVTDEHWSAEVTGVPSAFHTRTRANKCFPISSPVWTLTLAHRAMMCLTETLLQLQKRGC